MSGAYGWVSHDGTSRRARGLALAFALLLAACTSTPDTRQVNCRASCRKQAQMQPAAEREHQRILASYGGVYEDARLTTRSASWSTGWWRHPSVRISNTR